MEYKIVRTQTKEQIEKEVLIDFVSAMVSLDKAAHQTLLNPLDLDANLKRISDLGYYLRGMPFLEYAVTSLAMKSFLDCQPKESDVYEWFKKELESILPGYEISDKKSEAKHRPDFWLLEKQSGGLVPVEIKKNGFDQKGLRQLERYMSHYGAEYGIAVGSSLLCELPEKVKFISHKLN